MTRWKATRERLDEAYARLRLCPEPITCEAFRACLPLVPCFCQDPLWPWRGKGAECRGCSGTRMAKPQRAVAYMLLTKLEADGRATRTRPQYGGPHLWRALLHADEEVVEAHWAHLAELAPADPYADGVAEYLALAPERARLEAELAAILERMDAVVHALVEGDGRADRRLKDIAADLGVNYTAVNGHRWRHWARTERAEADTG